MSSSAVVVGLSLPKTGRYAQSAGGVYERAYNLWLKEINEKGGLLGRPVRFLVYDDGSTPEQAAENYRRLVHDDGLSSGAMKLCQWQNGRLEIVYPEFGKTAAPRL